MISLQTTQKPQETPFCESIARVEAAIKEFQAGRMVLLCDREDRENEGDLVAPAQIMKPEMVNFMATHAKGLICQSITAKRAQELELPLMVERSQEPLSTAFTISVDAARGITTGISANDRWKTINIIDDPKSKAGDLVRPGHLFPLIAHPMGLQARDGHTEASVELARLAGMRSSAVICEILDQDGSMARGERLEELSQEWGLKLLSIPDIQTYIRFQREEKTK